MAEKLSRDKTANIDRKADRQGRDSKNDRDRAENTAETGQKREQREYIFKDMTGTYLISPVAPVSSRRPFFQHFYWPGIRILLVRRS